MLGHVLAPTPACLTRGPGAGAGAPGRGTKALDWQMRRGVRARPSNIQPNFCASCDWGARKKERKSGIALVPNQMWRTRARVLSAGSVFFWSFLFFLLSITVCRLHIAAVSFGVMFVFFVSISLFFLKGGAGMNVEEA